MIDDHPDTGSIEIVLDARSGLAKRGVFDLWPSHSERVEMIDRGRGSQLDWLDEATNDLVLATNRILCAVAETLAHQANLDATIRCTWDRDGEHLTDYQLGPWGAKIWSAMWATADHQECTWTVAGQVGDDTWLAQRRITASPYGAARLIYQRTDQPSPPPTHTQHSTHTRCMTLTGWQEDHTGVIVSGPHHLEVSPAGAWHHLDGHPPRPLPSTEARHLAEALRPRRSRARHADHDLTLG